MSSFSNLPLGEQQARWRELALAALPHWRLEGARLGWLAYGGNAVFKVDAADGAYVLRLKAGGRAIEARLCAEVNWLRHIRQATNLKAPCPQPLPATAGGSLFLSLTPAKASARQAVFCTLFDYLPGEIKPASALGTRQLRQIGAYLGRLHREGQLQLPPGIDMPRLDWAGLFGVESPYHSLGEADRISPAQREVLDAVARRARETMRQLERAGGSMGCIHGDLVAKNTVFEAGAPAAIDFEYCGWGYFLYDLAPLLWQLKGERAADYPALEAALWAGYTGLQPSALPQRQQLEPLIAARQLASCRWLLAQEHAAIRAQSQALIKQRCDELRRYLETGILRRASKTL